MEPIFNKLFQFFRSRDSKTIEIYLDLLNAWWLFVLWYPGLELGIDHASNTYKYILVAAIAILTGISLITFILKKIKLRLAILACYSFFYFATGTDLLLRQPINVLGGVFFCQGILATLLTLKIQSRE